MTSLSPFWGSGMLQDLKEESEALGRTFYVNPPRDVVPAFLGDFQPDAMAVGPDGGIVIAMERAGAAASGRPLPAISKLVSQQKGWEFKAMYLFSSEDGTLPIAKPTPEQIEARFGEIEALTRAGHPAAALVTAWAVLEAIGRLAIDGRPSRIQRSLSPGQAVQRLAEEGYIDNDVARRLRELAMLCNAVVHGDFSVEVSAEQVDDLVEVLRGIAAEVMSVVAEDVG